MTDRSSRRWFQLSLQSLLLLTPLVATFCVLPAAGRHNHRLRTFRLPEPPFKLT
jgi:hypothetical protein